MTVFTVTYLTENSGDVVCVFATRALADAYVAVQPTPGNYSIEEFAVMYRGFSNE